MFYIISYTTSTPERREHFFEALKLEYKNWAMLNTSTFIVYMPDSEKISPLDIREKMGEVITDGEKVFIAKITAPMAWKNYSKNFSGWIHTWADKEKREKQEKLESVSLPLEGGDVKSVSMSTSAVGSILDLRRIILAFLRTTEDLSHQYFEKNLVMHLMDNGFDLILLSQMTDKVKTQAKSEGFNTPIIVRLEKEYVPITIMFNAGADDYINKAKEAMNYINTYKDINSVEFILVSQKENTSKLEVTWSNSTKNENVYFWGGYITTINNDGVEWIDKEKKIKYVKDILMIEDKINTSIYTTT